MHQFEDIWLKNSRYLYSTFLEVSDYNLARMHAEVECVGSYARYCTLLWCYHQMCNTDHNNDHGTQTGVHGTWLYRMGVQPLSSALDTYIHSFMSLPLVHEIRGTSSGI